MFLTADPTTPAASCCGTLVSAGLSVLVRLPSETTSERKFVEGTELVCPIKPELEPLYLVCLSAEGIIPRSREELFSPDDQLGPCAFLPPPLGDPPLLGQAGRTKLMLLVNHRYYKGFLDLDLGTDNDWLCIVRRRQGQIVLDHPLVNLAFSWKYCITDGSLHTYWSSQPYPRPSGRLSCFCHCTQSGLLQHHSQSS